MHGVCRTVRAKQQGRNGTLVRVVCRRARDPRAKAAAWLRWSYTALACPSAEAARLKRKSTIETLRHFFVCSEIFSL